MTGVLLPTPAPSPAGAGRSGAGAGQRRWFPLVFGVYLMMLNSAVAFGFSAISDTIKNRFDFSETEINLIGSFMNIGQWTGILGGITIDRYGHRAANSGAMAMVCGSCFAMYAMMAWGGGSISVAPWVVCAYFAGQGGMWGYLVTMKTNVANFPKDCSGRVGSTMLFYNGLGTGVFSQVFKAFFPGDERCFLLLAAVGFAANLAAIVGFRRPHAAGVGDAERRHLLVLTKWITGVGVAIAAVLLTASILIVSAGATPVPFGIAVACICAVFPLLLFLPRPGADAEPGAAAAGGEEHATPPPPPAALTGVPVCEALRTTRFWLFFFAFMGTIGPGMMVANNLAQLFVSHADLSRGGTYRVSDATVGEPGVPHYDDVSALVMLFGIGNAIGRTLLGFVLDATRKRVHPSAWLVALSGVLCATHVSFAYEGRSLLFVSVVPLGMAVGASFSVAALLAGDFWGMRHYASNFACILLAAGAGSAAMASGVGPRFVNHETDHGFVLIRADGDSDVVKYCFGSKCFRDAILVNAGVTAVACCLSAALFTLCYMEQSREESAPLANSSDEDGKGGGLWLPQPDKSSSRAPNPEEEEKLPNDVP